MKIGLPTEIKEDEYRVGMLPATIYQLIRQGHEVFVEKGAGAGAGYLDADYEKAGATLVESHEEVFEKGDLIVKVKEPQPAEFDLFKPRHTLFTYLHLAAAPEVTDALLKSG